MRKIIVGILIGSALTFGIQAGAAGLLSKGDKVANIREVTLNGKSLGNAAIVNDSSLIPVRPLTEAFGLNVDFDGGKINLTSPTSPEPTATSGPVETPAPTPYPYTEMEINGSITSLQQQIDLLQKGVDNLVKIGDGEGLEATNLKNAIKDLKDQLTIWQQRKAELED